MRRTPLVLTATVAGLVGVLVFHTTPSHLTLGTSNTQQPQQPASTASAASAPPNPQPASKSTSKPKSTSSPSQRSGTRTATGQQVNYNYGVLSVSVTVSGGKITKVGIASLDDGGNPRSQLIDQQSVPILEQEAMQAQSANIQGVSGASYTSAGFQQSLQSALQSLGLQ